MTKPAIVLSEREVVTVRGGFQSPWIARNLMVGETPLF